MIKSFYDIFCKIGAVLSIVLFLLLIISAYNKYFTPTEYSTLSIVALAFPYLVISVIVLSFCWLILRKWIYSICGIISLLICLPQLTISFPLNINDAIKNDKNSQIKIMSYNIYYGYDVEKPDIDYSRSISEILASDADIVCLQELTKLKAYKRSKITKSQFDSLRIAYPHIIETKGIDVMCLSKHPIEYIKPKTKRNPFTKRFDAYKVRIGNDSLTIINVHLTSFKLKNEQLDMVENLIDKNIEAYKKDVTDSVLFKLKNAFKRRSISSEILRNYLDSIQGDIIVCGDFNDVDNSWSYHKVKGNDFKDAHSEVGCGPLITYNFNHMWFGIDHILYKGSLRPIKFERGNLLSSDHYSISCTFEINNKLNK